MGIKIVDLVVLGGGPGASDPVHEVAVAMKGELLADDLASHTFGSGYGSCRRLSWNCSP